jgi:hypothetical protein
MGLIDFEDMPRTLRATCDGTLDPPPLPALVILIRQRKRETKTRRFARRQAGKAANQSNTTRRAPQLNYIYQAIRS